MGWPKKNEVARLYRDQGQVVLVMEDPGSGFRGLCETVQKLRGDLWTVKRTKNTEYVDVLYNGVIQMTFGPGTTLCLAEGPLSPKDATDEQVLRVYLGDEHIYTGEPRYPKPDGGYGLVRAHVPVTYGGTAKRITWEECPEELKPLVRSALGNTSPEEARGLHRVA